MVVVTGVSKVNIWNPKQRVQIAIGNMRVGKCKMLQFFQLFRPADGREFSTFIQNYLFQLEAFFQSPIVRKSAAILYDEGPQRLPGPL